MAGISPSFEYVLGFNAFFSTESRRGGMVLQCSRGHPQAAAGVADKLARMVKQVGRFPVRKCDNQAVARIAKILQKYQDPRINC
jgi:hypothetical protein